MASDESEAILANLSEDERLLLDALEADLPPREIHQLLPFPDYTRRRVTERLLKRFEVHNEYTLGKRLVRPAVPRSVPHRDE
jgi:hypothetical protein